MRATPRGDVRTPAIQPISKQALDGVSALDADGRVAGGSLVSEVLTARVGVGVGVGSPIDTAVALTSTESATSSAQGSGSLGPGA